MFMQFYVSIRSKLHGVWLEWLWKSWIHHKDLAPATWFDWSVGSFVLFNELCYTILFFFWFATNIIFDSIISFDYMVESICRTISPGKYNLILPGDLRKPYNLNNNCHVIKGIKFSVSTTIWWLTLGIGKSNARTL